MESSARRILTTTTKRSEKCATFWVKKKGEKIMYTHSSLISLVVQMVKNLPAMQETQVCSLCWEDPLEKGMATDSSILAWRILWTEEPGRLQSMGSRRVEHDQQLTLSQQLVCIYIYTQMVKKITKTSTHLLKDKALDGWEKGGRELFYYLCFVLLDV